ncbi:U3 small nucleolar ribonucleoprotein protein MPP10 [Phalaenopsis equestris]|uniref:U3 small nucleolar ribonucleoprotein protein MPP10 n=1 Tax=Phalaenopsis equestris TaxID=78828 RepID=UPI0009E3639B|nr:U3 small nucleolar ribonucleoprotein protein MPP10 [Phalaenopsis equestris]
MTATDMPTFDVGEPLERLCSADPALFLSPSSELSAHARAASRHLFTSLLPYCPKPPLDDLLTDDSFDAEQIWTQIDILSLPILSLIRREIKRLERVAPVVDGVDAKEMDGEQQNEEVKEDDGDEDDDVGEEEEKYDDDDEDDDAVEEDKGDGKSSGTGVEDKFLKIKELEDFLEDDEAREYGYQKKGGREKLKKVENHSNEDAMDADEDEEGDEDDAEFEDLDGEDEDVELARYEEFFGGKKGKAKNAKGVLNDKEGSDGSKEGEDEMDINTKSGEYLSTHEKQLLKLHSKIQQMEKANLEPKMWTMQGEVTAAKRPKNSALEVDLDFEHNVRPPPVITEEVTASIEDLIKKRIIEGQFDDVQRAPELPSRAPKEFKEMDETKSKKGLAEIYEEEYAQKAGLASAPLSSTDKQKEEASFLFKRLCLKLDALAHFHFAPKPVIEEMSIKANVPALAMEEIAPVAVSDAAMLAPEEVFQGKGDFKEEAELTQSDRRRRRANKKRRFKDLSNLSRSRDASAKKESSALSASRKAARTE